VLVSIVRPKPSHYTDNYGLPSCDFQGKYPLASFRIEGEKHMSPAVEELSRAQQQAHRHTVKSTPNDMARLLHDALGQKLVAYIANVSPKTVGRWVADETAPRAEAEERLSVAFYIFRLLSEVESSYVVRGWFAGRNPLLDEVAPATVIREDRMHEAIEAAKAYVSDG
jgi:hypothetical protein